MQPIGSDDVAEAVTDAALGSPINGIIEIAGSERMRLSDLVARMLHAAGDTREIVADPTALYFGAELEDGSLLPGDAARLWAGRLRDP